MDLRRISILINQIVMIGMSRQTKLFVFALDILGTSGLGCFTENQTNKGEKMKCDCQFQDVHPYQGGLAWFQDSRDSYRIVGLTRSKTVRRFEDTSGYWACNVWLVRDYKETNCKVHIDDHVKRKLVRKATKK
jgi:hypothetical protein